MLRKLVLYLIKPSKYDDDGYVIQHWLGVLPSNTLAALYGLTEDVRRRRALGEIEIETHLLDETIQRIPVDRICRANRSPHAKAAVMLVGVQTNQFPRAADLARQFRQAGVEVWIGGFHVSGMLAMFPGVSPEIQELLDIGVTVVKGEVEGRWEDLLRALVQGNAKALYDFVGDPPTLVDAPLPRQQAAYVRRFASRMGTIDCGRGCPFDCSFCCIITVQGHRMRYRDPQSVLAVLRENYRAAGIANYFFTDDNFARNKHWQAIFDGLIHLREVEGLPLRFMMQCDVLSYRIPNFVEKAQRAGCTQVFLGIESANPENLKAAEKRQNTLDDFRKLTAAWHAAGIVTHAAYIIGFPHDTPASVRDNLRFLTDELQVEQASFFMLGPIPGSRDHQRWVAEERLTGHSLLDPDFNRYDSFHPTMPHPRMTADEWHAVYRECWRVFYSFENMRAILSRLHSGNYWGVFRNFIFSKNAAEIEGEHPMITGFWRLKDRLTRRPGFPIPGRWSHFVGQLREKAHQIRKWAALLLEMEELWL
ncbi:MAG: radical SAM protein, partial [Chloroflexi bacterium]|nr:radical SAM protein [Chloroflexota bacterium]